MRLGAWTLHLAVDTAAKFPRLDDVLRRPQDATTRWALSPADAQFVLESLPTLLATEEEGARSVTLDLGSQAVVRTKVANDAPIQELLLSTSPSSGAPLQISTLPSYLLQALRLGLREFSFYGADTIQIGRGEQRAYCWMPAPPESVIAPSAEASRIESPFAGNGPVIPTPTKNITMPKPKPITNGHATTNGHTPAQTTVATEDETQPTEAAVTSDVLAEAVALKHALQDALGKTSALIAALRRQTRQSRLLRSTLQSLRELQHVSG